MRRRKNNKERRHVIMFVLAFLFLGVLVIVASRYRPPKIMPPEAPEMAAKRASSDNAFYTLQEAINLLPVKVPEPLPIVVDDDKTNEYKQSYSYDESDDEYPSSWQDSYEPVEGSLGHILGIRRPDDDEEFLAYLESTVPAIEKALEAFEKPYYLRPEIGDFNSPLPELAKYRHLGRLMTVRGLQIIRSGGDWNEGVEQFLNCAELGQLVKSDGMIIGYLVGVATQGLYHGYIYEVAKLADSPEQLREFQDRLLHYEETLSSPRKAFEFEWRIWDNSAGLAGLYSDGSNYYGNDPLGDTLMKVKDFAKAAQMTWVIAREKRIVRDNRELLLDGLSLTRLEFDEWKKPHSELLKSLENGHLMSGLLRLPEVLSRSQANLRGARLVIALELYQREHGEYPDELGALEPDFIEAMPVDPFSGDAFLYFRDVGDYTLYSVWRDGEDNNAKKNRDWVIHKPKEEKTKDGL